MLIDEFEYRRLVGLSDAPTLHMEVSHGCNIRCEMCTFHDDLTKVSWTPLEKVVSLREGLENFGAVHIGDGSEPLINPHLSEIVEHFHAQGLKVSVQTNAKLIRNAKDAERLVASGLNVLSISIDGNSDATVRRIREGVDYATIINAIDFINQAKQKLGSSTPFLIANAVAMRSNLDELPGLLGTLLSKGFMRLRVGFLELRKSTPRLVHELLIYERERAKATISTLRQCAAASEKSFYLDIELFEEGMASARRDACRVYRDRIYARADGEVFACYGKQRLGNLFVDGIAGCLSSVEYADFVGKVTQPENKVCRDCRFCRVMSLDNIEDHFGTKALTSYSLPVVEASLRWVVNGGKIEEFWSRHDEGGGVALVSDKGSQK